MQTRQSTFDDKHSFQSFWIVIFKHGEDLREGNTGMKKPDQAVERMRGSGPSRGGGANLSVSFDGGFPDVLQSESLAVVDQSDGLDVLPQLRGGGNTLQEGRERRKEQGSRNSIQTFSDCRRHSCRSISVCLSFVFRKSCLLADIRRPLGSRGPIRSYQMGLPSLS